MRQPKQDQTGYADLFEEEMNLKVGRYVLTNYIGEGAFGQVFLVKEPLTGKSYAIKVQKKKMMD